MQYGRVMGIDYGQVRIGIAMSDLMKTIASPYDVIKSVSRQKDVEKIVGMAKQNEVERFVLGLPLNMDGTEGKRAQLTRAFGDMLESVSGIPVSYQDERLSSIEAEDYLLEANVRRDRRKNLIDKVAACVILEQYLSSNCK